MGRSRRFGTRRTLSGSSGVASIIPAIPFTG
nr:MAG TPA: hypothetical protein [Caudoviricetes sp.]